MINRFKQLFLRYRFIFICICILALIGYTLLRVQAISNPRIDQAYIDSKNKTSLQTKIQIKDSVREQIEKLRETSVNVTPTNVGKPDPFSP